MFSGIAAIENLRKEAAFAPDAYVSTWDTHNDGVLALVRFAKEETLVGLFNFTGRKAAVKLDALEGDFVELETGLAQNLKHICLNAYEMKTLVKR